MATGLEDLGAIPVKSVIAGGDLSDLGAIPVQTPAQSLAQQQVDSGLLGSTGQTMSKEAALQKSMERAVQKAAMEGNPNIQMVTAPDSFITRNFGGMLGIPTPGQQNVVDVSQISGLGVPLSKARAISSGSSFGATDALERVLQDAMVKTGLTTPEAVQALGVQAQRVQNPEDELALNILGGVLPGGATFNAARTTLSAPTALSRILSGVGQGVKGGLATGVSEAITQEGIEDPLTTLSAIPENAALPVAGGVLLGGGVPAVGGLISGTGRMLGAVKNAIPEVISPKFEAIATDVVKPPKAAQESLIRDLKSGSFQDSLRSIEVQGRPTGLFDSIEKSIPALDDLSTRIDDHISLNKELITNNDDVADEIISLADSKRFRSKATKDQIKEFAETLKGDRTLRDGLDDLNELNELRRAYFEKSSIGQATDLDNLMHEAEQIARDRISKKMDDIYRATSGNTDNPYQQYGALKGLIGDLAQRGRELLTEKRIQISKGPSLEKEVLSTFKKNAQLFTGAELGRIDRKVVDMFNLLDEAQPTRIRPLTTKESNTLAAQVEDLQRQALIRQANSPEVRAAELNRVISGQRLPNMGEGQVNFTPEEVLQGLLK